MNVTENAVKEKHMRNILWSTMLTWLNYLKQIKIIYHTICKNIAYITILYHTTFTILCHTTQHITYCTVIHSTPCFNLPLYHTIPYHTIPYFTILHYIPYHTIQHHTLIYHTTLYHTLVHITLYHTIQHHRIPFHTIPTLYHTYTTPHTIQYYVTPHNTISHTTPTIPFHTTLYYGITIPSNITYHYKTCLHDPWLYASTIIGTWQENGSSTFWTCLRKMHISGNAIMSWKATAVIYKLLREGHPKVGYILLLLIGGPPQWRYQVISCHSTCVLKSLLWLGLCDYNFTSTTNQ